MANPGAGNKYLSVNLNKSYGQQGQHHHHHSNSYSSRTRVNNNLSGSGGNGGGMVVLSRPRSSQKAGPRLSVPPPLNLPSRRKEHEKSDSLGGGSGPAGNGVSGNGMRPSSSGMGWTKPVAAASQEDDLSIGGKGIPDAIDHDAHAGPNGVMNKAGGAYQTPTMSRTAGLAMEKSILLRGEDFPSLRATLPVASGPIQKLKDYSHQKIKQVVGEAISGNHKDNPNLSSHVDMRPQLLSSRHAFADGLSENGNHNNALLSYHAIEPNRKHDDFLSGPLPLVRLNPRSDWADDERDTSHGLLDRVKDGRFSKSEDHWGGDFDIPKASSFPHKVGHGTVDMWPLHDNETAKFTASEVPKAGSHVRDARIPSREGREGNSWRPQPFLAKELATVQESSTDARPSGPTSETKKDRKYMISPLHDGVQNDYGRSSQGAKLPWNSSREIYGNDHAYPSSLASKASSGSKGFIVKERRQISNNDKPYVENSFIKDVNDRWDSFAGSPFGVLKRKKDLLKQTDFHDPVRESFEAELERVQKMQELERQMIIDEQERALELERREEEERARLAREEEEKRRWLEEEAREAAWKAEQERLEAIRKAEEQRIAREEEKHRIFMEEERRKQAAKQKLLELEERIAKRQSEATADDSHSSCGDEKGSAFTKEIQAEDGGDWEDTQKTVDRIMLPASSDSTMISRSLDMGSGSNFSRDGSYLVESGKTTNNWRKDTLERSSGSSTFALQEQGGGHIGIRRESQSGAKAFSRKDLHGGGGFISSRAYDIRGVPEPQTDEFSNMRLNSWDFSDGDNFQKNIDVHSDISENPMHRYGGDAGWAQGHTHSNPYALYPDQYYQHSETDGLYSFARSRYSMKQPRVLPPPSLTSMHKNSHRGDDKHLRAPSFLNNDIHSSSKTEPTLPMDMEEELAINHHENVERKSDQETAQRCDSQSSLSVSSAPNSPVHLSHDDLDESGDYPVRSSAFETADFLISENGAGEANVMTVPSSGSSGDDAEWTLDNNRELQEQEEYDEYEEGLKEEDDICEVEDDNILSQELESINLKDDTSAGMRNRTLGVGGVTAIVEARVGSDELEISKRNEVSMFPVDNREDVKSFDMNGHIAQSHLHKDSCVQTVDHTLQETKKGIQGVVMEAHGSPTSDNPCNLYVTGCGTNPVTLAVPSATILTPESTAHSVMSSASASASAVAAQAEVPFKLQFGLFSGPSLIPTPVPSIQIGSIQMPLNMHPQVSPSLGSVLPSQTPLFQFGQLRYTSPIAPGVLPLAPKSMPSAHSSMPPDVSVYQSTTEVLPIQAALAKNNAELNSRAMVSQLGLLPSPSDKPLWAGKAGNQVTQQQGQVEHPSGKSNRISAYHDEQPISKSFSSSKNWGRQAQTGAVPSQPVKQDSDIPGAKGHGSIASSRRKHYVFKVKDTSQPDYETLTTDGTQYQRRPRRTIKRTEFRVRDVGDKRQTAGSGSSNHLDTDDKSNANANGRNATVSVMDSGNSTKMGTRKESFPKGQAFQQVHSVEGNFRRDASNEDIDAPLHSGIVRVFEQPGIEAPSDDDDFIEVRSKRQMLNDKREQREKEIKAKSRETKVSRRARSLSNASAPADAKSTSNRGEVTRNIHTNYASEDRGLTDFDVSSGFNTGTVPQPLAPIGTLAAKSEAQADIRSQTGKSVRATSSAFASSTVQTTGPCLTINDKNEAVDNVQTALHSWENSGINQQVMSLTQSQLDEAMKPAKFESRVSIGEHSIAVTEHINASCSSTLTKEMPFSSAASPINSLLAGEKIQFGAVTSPTVLPPSSHSVSHGIGPVSCQSQQDAQNSQKKLPGTKNDCTIFFEKEKLNESCVRLEDCEADAAASAVAIAAAAISNDEIVGNGLSTCSVSVSVLSKSFDMNRRSTAGGQYSSSSQLRVEEPLNVSLPADLSVETPPISLWPSPLTTSQSPSNQMLSHFPGAPQPSHFPFYDINMNTMMGSPIFAFGPNEESGSTQPQKSGPPGGGPPHMTWQQCHSVDSFYGPPAGYTGPFISPGGVQGPPHMVVYNHFAPVGGQYGQVGLSFMGTTFIPSGKQPDWKHNPSSSSSMAGEGDVNMNMVSAQRDLPSSIHHLAPGSPLLPMASSVAMFDVLPFQGSGEMPVHHHARWSPLPSSALQSIPMAMSVVQKAEASGAGLSEYNNNVQASSADASTSAAVHSSSSSSTAAGVAESSGNAIHQQVLPDELGLESSSISNKTETSGGGDNVRNTNNSQQQHQYRNYQGQRGASFSSSSSQKNNVSSSSEWSSHHHQHQHQHRRGGGFQGRNHHSFGGVEKSFPPSKVKQIYVAKQSSSSSKNQSSTTSSS